MYGKIKLICQTAYRKQVSYFEVRSLTHENRYNNRRQLNSIMQSSSRPADIEEEQKFDRHIVAELVKALEILQNLED